MKGRLGDRSTLEAGSTRGMTEARLTTTIEATFDGKVLRPSAPISLEPNTTVRLTDEPLPDQPASFLRTARSLNLEGPPGWATNLGTSRRQRP
jgi:hypothetical protein